MKATVIYPQEATFQIDVPDTLETDAKKLGYVWEATNPDSGNTTLATLRLRLRSSMVGDIYQVNGRSWMVDGHGFVELSERQSVAVQRVESRDRIMGWKWIRDHHPEIGDPIFVLD